MKAPFLCRKCGTVYSAQAVEALAVVDAKCRVCGGTLEQRTVPDDPPPSRKGEGWLLFAGFPWEFIAVGAIVAGALATCVN